MSRSDESYYEIIDRCARDKEDFPIQNGAPAHASYLLKTFFKYADSNVRIFTGRLFHGVFDNEDIRKEAVKFLQKGSDKKLTIAYNKEPVDVAELLGESFLLEIKSSNISGTVEVWKVTDDIPHDSNHFAVMDRSAFRFETNHEDKKAIANFGDGKSAGTLTDVFEKILTKSSRVVTIPEPECA